MSSLLQDIRYGLRTLSRAPGFTAIAVTVLAIGIGANAVVFSLANAFFLRPLAAPDPERIVRVYSNRYSNTPYRSFVELRDRNSTLAGLAGLAAAIVWTPHRHRDRTRVRHDRQRRVLPAPGRRGGAGPPDRDIRRSRRCPRGHGVVACVLDATVRRGAGCHRSSAFTQRSSVHDRRRCGAGVHGGDPSPGRRVLGAAGHGRRAQAGAGFRGAARHHQPPSHRAAQARDRSSARPG